MGVFYRRGSETPALTRADLHSQKTQTGGSETPELTNGACRPKVATFDLLRLFWGGIFLLQLDVMYTKKRGDNSPGASGNCSHFASHTEGTTPQERQATARILRATQATAHFHLRATTALPSHTDILETSEKFLCTSRVEGSLLKSIGRTCSYTTRLHCPMNRQAHYATSHGSSQVLSHSVVLMS